MLRLLLKAKWVICFLFIALSVFALIWHDHPIKNIDGRFFRDAADMDVCEYHFLAVNLYAEGKFPLIGFLRPEPYYHLPADDPADIPRGEIYRNAFRKAGPVTFTKPPPLYPLIIACLYHIWGYDMTYPLIFNFFLLALIAASLVTWAWRSYGWRGLMVSSASMALFYRYSPYDPYVALPDLLLVLLLLLFFICFISAERTQSTMRYFVAGALFILAILTKSYLMPMWGVLLVTFIVHRRLIPRPYLKFGYFTAGILALVIPWMLYINPINNQARAARGQWKMTINKEYPTTVELDTMVDLIANKKNESESFKKWVSQFYSDYMETVPFIITSSQYVPRGMLKYHNELCVDGSIHGEYFLIKKSFYYALPPDMPASEKIYLFYKAHPDLLFTIAFAKMRLGFFAPGFPVVVLAAILQALALFTISPVRHKWWVTFSCLLLLLAGVLLFYYENVFLAFTIIFSLYSLFFMPKRMVPIDFILYQSFIITMFAVTVMFHGNRPYIAVIEPLSWFIFFKSIYDLIRGALRLHAAAAVPAT